MFNHLPKRLMLWSVLSAFFCAITLTVLFIATQPVSMAVVQDVPAQTAEPTQTPKAYTPPETDADSLPIAEANLDADLQTLDGEHYSVMLKLPFNLSQDGTLALNFANPDANDVWLLLDIRLKENNLLLYRTGRIAPGHALPTIQFSKEALELLQAQGEQADLTIVVYSFAFDTYQSMGEIRLNAPVLMPSETPMTNQTTDGDGHNG